MLTRSKVQQLHDDRLDEVRLSGAASRPPLGRWLTDGGVVAGRWPRGLGLAWTAVFAAAIVVEPAPANPGAPEPLWAGILFLGLFAALGAMAAGLAHRQRLGLIASIAAGGLALVGTVMCPVSDHHSSVGAWWYLQMVGFSGLIGASLVGLRRSRSAPASTG